MYLLMKPICKCGHVFKSFRCETWKPNAITCPECGQEYEGVVFQTPVGKVFEYDEEKYPKMDEEK